MAKPSKSVFETINRELQDAREKIFCISSRFEKP